MKLKACCKICGWEQKATGVYESHYASRRHMKEQHPTEFEVMNKEEHAIRDLQSQLNQKFGLAVRPLGMNI